MISRRALLTLSTAIMLGLAGCSQDSGGAGANDGNDAPAATVNAAAPDAMTGEGGDAGAAVAAMANTGEACGGIAGIQCTSRGDFCKTKIGQCKTADAPGTCTKKPQVCTEQYMPVCGCDGKTYGNACNADAAGVNVERPGKCEDDG